MGPQRSGTAGSASARTAGSRSVKKDVLKKPGALAPDCRHCKKKIRDGDKVRSGGDKMHYTCHRREEQWRYHVRKAPQEVFNN